MTLSQIAMEWFVNLLFAGVGNCLDVACAIALWGCSLPANLLRRLIYVTLVEFGTVKYMSRWRRQQSNDGHSDSYLQVSLVD